MSIIAQWEYISFHLLIAQYIELECKQKKNKKNSSEDIFIVSTQLNTIKNLVCGNETFLCFKMIHNTYIRAM